MPNIISRNYVDSLPMNHHVPFDSNLSYYRYSTLKNDHKRVIKFNTEDVAQSNLVNKKMKSDLLSSHFSVGSMRTPIPSESQSNFYKKKSEAGLMAMTRAKLKSKIERQNFKITGF